MFVMFERPFINIESTFFRNNHHSSSKHRNNISTNSKGMNPTMNR